VLLFGLGGAAIVAGVGGIAYRRKLTKGPQLACDLDSRPDSPVVS
jgi:hypothetical protein